MSSRRQLLRIGLAAGALGTSGGVAGLFRAMADPVPAAAVAAPVLTPFGVPLTVPPVLSPIRCTTDTDYYAITMSRARREILPGTRTEVLTYNGGFPGPTIRARTGRRVVVRQTNRLDMPTSVHLHGGATTAENDGSAMDTIAPGASRTYTYANQQPNATLWMHDHAHHMESEHVYRGLASLYLLTDPVEAALPLPGGRYDIPLLLRDAHFDDAAQLVYTMDDAERRSTILVNGRPWPHLAVQGRKYRFRLVNTSNLRTFVLRLDDMSPFTLIGSDGGLLERPFITPILVLSPGERLDLVIDFSRFAPGTKVVLQNLIGPGPVDQVSQVMRFDVGNPVNDPSSVPETLRTLPPLPTPTVRRTFELKMDAPGTGMSAYINGKTFDPNRIDTEITWGTTEEWTVTNVDTTIPHNLHLHLVQFRLVERNGAPVDPSEAGLKDTVLLFPGQTVKLLATFDRYKGVYPYHCHLIDHGGMGMMAQMKIV